MEFTMKHTAHPERLSAFEKKARELRLHHRLNEPGKPWQNGFIERSNRTDNEELFHVLRFASSEERRYQLWLYEAYYNRERPHQGLGGRTPLEVFRSDYRAYAFARFASTS
jgi:transposase InsO family protein